MLTYFNDQDYQQAKTSAILQGLPLFDTHNYKDRYIVGFIDKSQIVATLIYMPKNTDIKKIKQLYYS